MYEYFAHMYVCIPCMSLVSVESEEGAIYPGNGVMMAVNYRVGARN